MPADVRARVGALSESGEPRAAGVTRNQDAPVFPQSRLKGVIEKYYPHLTLATHQRFASKGGYLAHFADASGSKLVADSDWLTP